MHIINKFVLSAMTIVALLSTSCKSQMKSIESKNIAGTWFVTQQDDSIWQSFTTISFDDKNGTFGAYNACNSTSGSFRILDGKVLETESDGISTLRYCPCESYFGYTSGRMLLFENDGSECLEVNNTIYRRPGNWMLNGNWSFDFRNSEMTLSINAAKKLMSLLSDGKTYVLNYKTSKNKNSTKESNSISIKPIVSEEILSKAPENVRELINLLSKVEYFDPSEGMCQVRISLLDNHGQLALQLYREMQ